MKLPDTVKIGAWEYTVTEWHTRDANRDGFYAKADHAEHSIKIDTAWGEKQAAASLLHEILHCVFKQWEIDDEKDSQERLVSTLERGLSTVWRENPKVMRWIEKGLSKPR